MPLQGTLLADFDSFTNAVANAQTSLAGFETNAGKVETALTRMTTTMEGGRIVQQATLAAQAIEDIGGVTKLTTAELERWSSVAGQAADKLTAMGKDVPPGIQALADATTNVHGAWSSFIEDFKITDAIEHPLATATAGMSALAESMGPAAVQAVSVATGVVAIGTALFELTSRAAESGERIQDFSTKTGMSVPAVSTLSKALTVAGGDMNGVGNALFILEKNMGEMSPKFESGMNRLKISSDDFKDAGVDGYLELIATKLAATDDPIQRTTALAELFGRQGRELAPILAKLADSLELTKDFTPWTAEQAKAAEDFQMAMRSLQLHVEAFVGSIGKDFLGPAKLFLDAITASKDGLVTLADSLTGGVMTAFDVAREAQRGAADILQTLAQKVKDVRAAYSDLPPPVTESATAFDRFSKYVMDFSWGQFAKDTIREVAAGVHVLTDEIGNLPEVGGPALSRLGNSTEEATKKLEAMQLSSKSVALGQSEIAKAITDLEAPIKKHIAAWDELNSMGTSYADTVSKIDPVIVGQAEKFLKAGAAMSVVAAAWPELSAAQVKALDQMVKQYEATYKAIEKIEGDHVKKAEVNEFGLSKLENEQSQLRITDEGKASTQLLAIDKQLQDTRMQQSTDRYTYENMKLWEAADAQIAAFTKTGATAQQVTEFANKVYEITATKAAELDATATRTLDHVTEKAQAAAAALGATMQSMQGGEKLPGAKQETDFGTTYILSPGGARIPLGAHGEIPKNFDALYSGASTIPQFAGGVQNFGGGLAIVGERGPELVNLPAGSNVLPTGAGLTVTNHFYVNGTAADVARQVADVLMRSLRSTQQFPLR